MRYGELILTESGSRGVFSRTQDASEGKIIVFKNSDGKTITALGNVLFPVDGMYFENDTVAMLPAAAKRLPPFEQKKLLKTGQQKVLEALDQYKIQAKIANNNWHIVNNDGRAALVTLWTNERKQVVAFVKLFNSKSLNSIPFFWSNSDFARDTGYTIENVSQQKFDLNLKPSTVVGVNNQFTVDDLLDQVSENILSHTELPTEVIEQVPLLLKNVRDGYSTPIANASQYLNPYEIDLGETAAPIALMTGHLVSGAYKQVADQLLKPMGSSWAKIKTCSFPMAGNEQLVDSYLHINKSTRLGISSKNSKGGAAASVTSLTSAIEKNPERYTDLLSQKKYKYLFNVLNLIAAKSAIDGVLELGVMYTIIDKADQIKIKALIDDVNADKKDVTKKLQKLLSNPIYKPNTKASNYCFGLHLLTTVAYLVTAHLNEKSNIVTSFFKEMLSRSDMIQVKTKMKVNGDGVSYTDFEVIWPAVFEGNILFQCQKNYSASSRPAGKLCMKIN
jgi:hypothetical protein